MACRFHRNHWGTGVERHEHVRTSGQPAGEDPPLGLPAGGDAHPESKVPDVRLLGAGGPAHAQALSSGRPPCAAGSRPRTGSFRPFLGPGPGPAPTPTAPTPTAPTPTVLTAAFLTLPGRGRSSEGAACSRTTRPSLRSPRGPRLVPGRQQEAGRDSSLATLERELRSCEGAVLGHCSPEHSAGAQGLSDMLRGLSPALPLPQTAGSGAWPAAAAPRRTVAGRGHRGRSCPGLRNSPEPSCVSGVGPVAGSPLAPRGCTPCFQLVVSAELDLE